jgi:sugar phosphate isomerase/epimerase
MAEITRLSLNQITVSSWSVSQAVEGCVRHGIPAIALRRHKIEEAGLASCVRNVKDAGLHVSSVCRGGMFPSPTAAGRQKNLEDSFRAVDEAAALRADSLVLVVGGGRRLAWLRREKWSRTLSRPWSPTLANTE